MDERGKYATAEGEGIRFAGSDHRIEAVDAPRSLSAPMGALPSPALEVPLGTPPRRAEPKAEDSYLRRNRVVEEYAHLINRVAFKMIARLPPNVEIDDLKSAGVIGLIDAAEKYDPEKSTNFRSYAEIRIRGAMVDELRTLDWVPRSVRQRRAQIELAGRTLSGRLGRPATQVEVAEALGLSLNDYRASLEKAHPISLVSYEDLGVGGREQRGFLESVADPQAADPEQASTHSDRRDLLLKAIQQLGERPRVVLSLYYFEDLNLKEIGQILGVTESRISQIHSKSVRQLRPILDAMMAD